MSKFDQLIEDTLADEDQAVFAEYGEQGLFGQIGGLFTGKLGWVNAVQAVAQIALFAGAIYAVVNFLRVDGLPEMIRWGGLAGLLMLAVSVIKLMQWEQMQTNRVIREVKRVELRLAGLR